MAVVVSFEEKRKGRPAGLDGLMQLCGGDLERVNHAIVERMHSPVELIPQLAKHLVEAGGKRLRPLLTLAAARLCNYRGDKHILLSACVEFIHTATLLHDDVVDESDLRRGRETANALFGNSAAVLVGDFLYSRSFQMMVGVGDMRVMRILADATNVIAEGEVLQLLNVHNADVGVEAYLQVIHYKTATLFEAATRLGAVIGGVDEDGQARLALFGRHIGTAFQLIDDVLDYSGAEAETGKHLGDDLAEGKPTLPLIHVMQHGSPAQSALVRQAIETGGRDAFADVLQAVQETGALAATREYAAREAAIAAKQLDDLPASIFKDALLQLCSFAVTRQH